LDPVTSRLLAPEIVNAELAQRTSIYATYTPQKLWSGPFLKPSSAAVGDIYGLARSYNHGPVTSYHSGLDFMALEDSYVVAAAGGWVAFSGSLPVRGNSVIIDHGMGVFTGYHHLSDVNVAKGQSVQAGDLIGLSGHTGLASGPHLHWEVLIRGIEVDGLLWLQGRSVGP
jgi:murein DD-endopeptidase MepM/ murein hydrolase activator NlpD